MANSNNTVFEVEDGYPIPDVEKGKCIYPFDQMCHGQSFFISCSPSHIKKTRDHVSGRFRRWRAKTGRLNLASVTREVREDGVNGLRFWLVDKEKK